MIKNLFGNLSVLILLSFCFVSLAFAVDYEDKVSDSNYSNSAPSTGNTATDAPDNSSSMPSTGNTNSSYSSDSRSTKEVLKDSANSALGSIIGAIGESINQALKGAGNRDSGQSLNQPNTPRDTPNQQLQDNTGRRGKKRITDY